MKYDPLQAIIEEQEASKRIEEGGLPAALENLQYKFGTMDGYTSPGLINDAKLLADNPEHPLASPQRFIRMGAADFIYSKASELPQPSDKQLLDQLHASLFDCCASVRLSVANALRKLSDPSSLPFLERLMELETESDMVRDAVATAIEVYSEDSGIAESMVMIPVLQLSNLDALEAVQAHLDQHKYKSRVGAFNEKPIVDHHDWMPPQMPGYVLYIEKAKYEPAMDSLTKYFNDN